MNIEETPTPVSYTDMVIALCKHGEDILAQLTPAKIEVLHYAVGVSGEAGELLDAIKKHTIYNKPIDRVNVIEELGDLEFFMEALRRNLGITREETLQGNVDKLSVRYKNLTYSDEAAQARADKM